MGIPHAEKVMFHDQDSSIGRQIGNLCRKKNEEFHKGKVATLFFINQKIMYFDFECSSSR